MPILGHEPDLFPETLLEEGLPAVSDVSWYAMYTLSRREKDLMRRLKAQNIAYYGPMAPTRKRSPAGRVRVSYLPLFTGYVFVCGTPVDRYNAVATGCISKCLDVLDPDELREDLKQIRLLIEKGGDVRPEPKPMVGRPARVISGPMMGAEGTVSQVLSRHRLTVLVTFMQQGASVTVDEADLEFLD
ncbi:MAG: transcription termination/antitermination NusG family protein [Planctomycetaceae bacterium]